MTKHEVLVGPYRSGKSWLLLERAVEHCLRKQSDQIQLSREATIIVPSQRYRSLLEERLASLLKEKTSGIWGLKILTFYQFCQANLLKRGIFSKVLPEAARSPLLLEVSQQLLQEKKIKKLAPILGLTGTQSAMLALIDEWQRSGYHSNDIIQQLNKYGQAVEHRAELALIYEHYEKTLQQTNYVDNHGLVFRLIDLLNRKEKSAPNDFIASDLVIVDGFDRLNTLQIKLLAALAADVPELYISFDYQLKEEEQHEGDLYSEYSWKDRSYEQLKNLLGKSFTFTEHKIKANHFEKQQSEQEYFAASDRLAEMTIIAARVKEAIALNKIAAEEIVVTARNLKLYKAAVEAVFQDAGLEYYMDEAVAMIGLPIIRFMLSFLSLAENDFPRRQLIDCLRSPYFKLSAFQLTKEDIEQLNDYSLRFNLISGKDHWLKVANYRQIGNSQIISKALKEIFDLCECKSTSALAYVTWAEGILDRILDLSMAGEHASWQLNWTINESISNFRRTLAALVQEENIVNKISANQSSSNKIASHYYARLHKLIEKANFPVPKNTGKVLVTSAELVPNRQFKQIYLAGMLEGEFPAVKNGNGFLTPEELAEWKRAGIEVYNPRNEAGFEYALFISLVNRAQEKITLSYPVAEISNDEESVPSFFFTALREIDQEQFKDALSFDVNKRAINSPRNALAYALWTGDEEAYEKWQTLAGQNYALSSFAGQLQEKFSFAVSRAEQMAHSSLNGYLADHVAASTVKINLPEYWSASQLGVYGKCPFSFWLERMLEIMPHEEPEPGLSFIDRGTFYHKVLELFYKDVVNQGLSMATTDEAESSKLERLYDQAIEQGLFWLEEQRWFQPTEFWQQDKKELSFRLKNFYASEKQRFIIEAGQYAPYMVEAAFGPDENYPPLVINANGKTIKFRGKVDRIDINQWQSGATIKNLRLIDYKSGSSTISRKDFETGRNIQLPLYALATKQSVIPNSNIDSYMYLSISTGEYLSPKKQDNQSINEDLNLLQEQVVSFVERIEKGDFSVRPSEPKLCAVCVHQTVCRVDEFPNRKSELGTGEAVNE